MQLVHGETRQNFTLLKAKISDAEASDESLKGHKAGSKSGAAGRAKALPFF